MGFQWLSRLIDADEDSRVAGDEPPPEIEEFVARDPQTIPPDEGDMTRQEWEAQHG